MTIPKIEQPTVGRAFFLMLLAVFTEPAGFCIWWNIAKTHEAVGLGTVNYWTALGVNLAASSAVASLATAAYGGVHSAKRLLRSVYE